MIKFIFKQLNNILLTILYLYRQLKYENFKNYISINNVQLKNETLTILANGPSLNNILSTYSISLKNTDICVVNDFSKSPLYETIMPNIYVLADPLYFNILNMRQSESETINNINDKTKWNMYLFVPFIHYKTAKLIFTAKNIKIRPFHSNIYNGWTKIKYKLYKIGLSSPRIQNVLIACIFNAINLKYKNINLYGVDHSWTKDICVNNKNEVCLINHHFYDTQTPQMSPWLKCNGEQYLMHEILRDLAYMFEGYHELKDYAQYSNCNIHNFTKNSFIDAFHRE